MVAQSETEEHPAVALAPGTEESLMVARMRVVLAVAVLLTIVVDANGNHRVSEFAWLFSSGYMAYSLAIYACSHGSAAWTSGPALHWMDLGWYAAIVLVTGGAGSIFFLFFFFAILTASFRYGLEEGVRVSVASAALFAASGALADPPDDLPQLLMRTTFLLALGYMSAQWGESKVAYARRLSLLRDVSRISNPRFGVDRTVSKVLQQLCAFFRGDACLLVLQDRSSGTFGIRTVKADPSRHSLALEPIDAEIGRFLLSLPVQVGPGNCRLAECMSLDETVEDERAAAIADLLGRSAFLSADVQLRNAAGRIFVLGRARWRKGDAAFLAQAVSHAYSVIENIELLDRMATEAASEERKRLGWNFHDSAIQPYLGLQLGLSALHHKTPHDSPLREDVDRLVEMTESVILELRQLATHLTDENGQADSALAAALRRRIEHFKRFHQINLSLRAGELSGLSDRLSAEVLSLVSEGLSNIRRHTRARRGMVMVESNAEGLMIVIENEADTPSADFTPRSISERAAALGGRVRVIREAKSTSVQISIPV